MNILSWIQRVYCATVYTCQIEYCTVSGPPGVKKIAWKETRVYEWLQYIRGSLHFPFMNTVCLLLIGLTKRLDHNPTYDNIRSCCCSVLRKVQLQYCILIALFCIVNTRVLVKSNIYTTPTSKCVYAYVCVRVHDILLSCVIRQR